MNPHPGKNSVLILDNARIHHNAEWIELVEGLGGRVEFLPPYSPDFNPIELAFCQIKMWLKRHYNFVETFSDDPIYPIMYACAQITSETASSFFHRANYL
jgi:transposase